eukprot:1630830-Pyramimonas_sp.AAC.1
MEPREHLREEDKPRGSTYAEAQSDNEVSMNHVPKIGNPGNAPPFHSWGSPPRRCNISLCPAGTMGQ